MLDLAREAAVQACIREAIAAGLVRSAQDVAAGGLATALAECAILGSIGARADVAVEGAPAVELFGESPSRIVATCDPADLDALRALAEAHGVPLERLGSVGGDRLVISLVGRGATGAAEERGARVADEVDIAVVDLVHAWEHGLPRALGEDA
jgi:phosphoribosylformylglycinamidine synthase